MQHNWYIIWRICCFCTHPVSHSIYIQCVISLTLCILCVFLFLQKRSVLLHAVCNFTHFSLLGRINLDLRYFVAKSLFVNLTIKNSPHLIMARVRSSDSFKDVIQLKLVDISSLSTEFYFILLIIERVESSQFLQERAKMRIPGGSRALTLSPWGKQIPDKWYIFQGKMKYIQR